MTQTDPPSHPAGPTDRARRPTSRAGGPGVGPIGEGSAAEVARQIGALARAGLPLASGLRALAAEIRVGPARRLWHRLRPGGRDPARLCDLLHLVADDIEAGVPLDEALASQGDRFPAHLRGLILAGSRSGRLAEMLGEFLTHYRAGDEIRRRVWLGLFYPAALLSACLGTFALLASMLSNDMVEIIEDFGVDMPLLTLAFVDVARAFAGLGIWVVAGPLLLVLVLLGLEMMLFRPAERRRQLLAVPLIGPLWRWTAMAEFCHALSALTAAELPLAEALTLAGRAARDASLESTCEAVAADLGDGLPLSEALARHGAFPEGLARFLRWAEGQRSLPESLELAAEVFEARAKAQGEFVATFLGLLAAVIVIWWLVLIFGALVWPMVDLIARLAG